MRLTTPSLAKRGMKWGTLHTKGGLGISIFNVQKCK